jgi:serine/threonine protein phosphatase PrpC
MRARARLSWAAHSDPGCEGRHNEDAWQVCEADGLLLLADGMGGYNAGDVASAIAVREAMGALRVESGLLPASAARLEAIDRAIGLANAAILTTAARRPECLGMLSTLCVAWIDERVLTAGHVGDSRLYLWRSGRLIRATRDHAVEQPQPAGDEDGDEAASGAAGAARTNGGRRSACASLLTRALGVEPQVDVDLAQFEWMDGDRLLLCTDGLTDFVGDRLIAECLADIPEPQPCAQALVAAALASGGHDNVTVITACLSRDR